jgi:ADP-heptose:LPS heptosyltransferase
VSVLEQLPDRARVAVIRLRSLGDCVLTTPALSLLHAARPDLQLGVVVEPRFGAIFEGNPAVARILPPAPTVLASFRPDLCLNLHGGTRSMWLTAASLARFRAGFTHHKGSFLYNEPIPRAQQILGEERTVHTAEHLASAMFHLGVPHTDIPRASLFANTISPKLPYAVIHPTAATASKTWTTAGFRSVAEHLRDEHQLEPIFIAGLHEDVSPFSGFRTVVGAPLAKTKELLKGASVFIGNDSGPAHMAAAFGLPVVVLFGSSDSVVWAPWRTACEVLAEPAGIERISVSSVIAAVDRVRVRA